MNRPIARVLLLLLRGYRLLLSPWLGSQCRFEPTCSRYAIEAIDRHGAALGTYLTAARIVRCHPWCQGGHDPVPERAETVFGRRRATNAPTRNSSCGPTP